MSFPEPTPAGRPNKGKARAQDAIQLREATGSTSPSDVSDINELYKNPPAARGRSNTVTSLDYAMSFLSTDSPRAGSFDMQITKDQSESCDNSLFRTRSSSLAVGPQIDRCSNFAFAQSCQRAVDVPFSHWTHVSQGSYEDRQAKHKRAKSSLGSSNVFDFFGPSSVGSSSSAASSFQQGSYGSLKDTSSIAFGSPKDSSSASFVGLRDYVLTSNDFNTPVSKQLPEIAASSRASSSGSLSSVAVTTEETRSIATTFAANEAVQRDADNAAEASSAVPNDPPNYAHEALPSYEEAPAYTPPHQSRIATMEHQPHTPRPSRFLTSRFVKKLNLPSSLVDRLEHLHSTAQSSAASSSHGPHQRRSGSLPELYPLSQNGGHSAPSGDRTMQSTTYRYNVRPRDPAWGGRQPRRTVVPRHMIYVRAPTSTQSQPPTTLPSRRNSRESRRSSRTTATSTSLSGAATPSLSSHGTPARSTRLRLQNLADRLTLRKKESASEAHVFTAAAPLPSNTSAAPARMSASEMQSSTLVAESGLALRERETISPVAEETLISARLPSSLRPPLLNTAHSCPLAGVSTAPSSPSLIVPRLPSLFEQLPREIILVCFRELVESHVRQHESAIEQGKWRGKTTLETQWVGLEAAVRELARLGRVSRSWQSYTMDGQLWQSIDFSVFPQMSDNVMLKIARSAGPFIRKLDLHGVSKLKSSVLVSLFEAQCPRQGLGVTTQLSVATESFNQLQELNLEGCRQVSAQALLKILSKSGNLKKCNISNLDCVSDATLYTLARTAKSLEVLNISRCRHVNGEGIRTFLDACYRTATCERNSRHCSSVFRELHAAGIKGMDAATLNLIGLVWPNVEVLDLSYCSDINDAVVAALVSSAEDLVQTGAYFVPLSPRQAGSSGDEEIVRRIFPYLKKLKLSSCRALTDRACIELAYAVPALQVLELANIGASIRDTGLVKFLATVPHLQRLDLERAMSITDAVLSALTPPESHASAYGRSVPEESGFALGLRARGSLLGRPHRSISRRRGGNRTSTQEDAASAFDQAAVAALIPATGTHLTHLILSSANKLTSEAMLLLINRCPFLYHLELDDTHANNAVATQFVRLARFRKIKDAHLSLVDCRSFTRDSYSQLTHIDGADGGVRPRNGERGYAYRHFHYDDAEPALVSSANASDHDTATSTALVDVPRTICLPLIDKGNDECNRLRPVLKSFWGWQSVDARTKHRRRMELRSSKRGNKSKVSNVVAMALGLQVVAPQAGTADAPINPRWSRILPTIGTPNFDDDDTSACVIM